MILNIESNIKNIKKLIFTLLGKDSDVILTYKGTSYGVTSPWHIRCDVREANSTTFELASQTLFDELNLELKNKIISSEKQTENFKNILNSINIQN